MTQPPHYAQKYRIKGNRLYETMAGKNGSFERLLCNFVPWITAEITLDDGAETTTWIRLRGIHESGRPLPEIEIPAAELAGFNWLAQRWGMDCILEVGKTVKDCVRHAIQTTAAGAEKKTVYTVTGWKNINGKWMYPEFPATGWEHEREDFFRHLRNPAYQSQGYGNGSFGGGQKAEEAPHYHIGGIDATLGAGLRGLASAGRLIEDDSEDPEERRKRIQAEQAGSNVGAILGLAIGAAMALTETESPGEQQATQDEQDFNEFLAQLEAEEEEEQTFQLSM